MDKIYQISLFPLNSIEGEELCRQIKVIILQKMLGNVPRKYDNLENYVATGNSNPRLIINIFDRKTRNVTMADFLQACLDDDLVIVDVTREGKDNETNNFDIVNELPKQMEHVWVISRNYLPINFYGIRKGGYPTYKEQKKTNADICLWIGEQLSSIDFSIPRNPKGKGIDGMRFVMDSSMNQYYQRRHEEANVFISFRTRYEKSGESTKSNGYKFSVNELAERIRMGKYPGKKAMSVTYLDDGNLVFSTELNTKQRAWQLLSIIDRDYIIHCDEFWIYGSFDYLNSWWTVGELLVFSYLVSENIDRRPNKSPRKLILYDPKSDTIQELPIPAVNATLAKQMARIQSNCATGSMGLDSVIIIRLLRDILHGSRELHDKAIRRYTGYMLQLLPFLLRDKGADEESIKELINSPNIMQELQDSIDTQIQSLKTQIESRQAPEDLKLFLSQTFDIQSQILGKDLRETIKEDELLETGFSYKYLIDNTFSEDFWENIVLLDKGVELKKTYNIKDGLNSLHPEDFERHLNFNYPITYNTIGNISYILTNPEFKNRVEKKPSRFIFMPSRGGIVDFSPTHNNLYELPIYILN